MPGDELRLTLPESFVNVHEWSGNGHVREVFDGEVTLEMSSNAAPYPLRYTVGFVVEMVWNCVRYAARNVASCRPVLTGFACVVYVLAALTVCKQR